MVFSFKDKFTFTFCFLSNTCMICVYRFDIKIIFVYTVYITSSWAYESQTLLVGGG